MYPRESSARESSNLASYDVLGIPVTITSLEKAGETIRRWSEDDRGRFVCMRDVHGVMLAQDDHHLLNIHRRADMVAPDGMPLVLLGWLKGLPVSRACGPDLMGHICARSAQWGLKHYFYGGTPDVAAELARKLSVQFPGLSIVGIESPPFRRPTPEEDAETVQRIKDSGADIVWVGLSTPKQERWMSEHAHMLPATLIGVGAAFDFHAGTRSRAPMWMQKLAFEWLYRLLLEPRRLWRRYLVLAPQFTFRIASGTLRRRAA
jgi:N-acetylglucosaminyldiphosphoundecaprenol N-acetyl-beta-D-mannosaminyltransferase